MVYRGGTPPLGGVGKFLRGRNCRYLHNMFYNTFFINFDNQNDRKLDLSKNQIKQRNPASFFNWILLSQTVTLSPN